MEGVMPECHKSIVNKTDTHTVWLCKTCGNATAITHNNEPPPECFLQMVDDFEAKEEAKDVSGRA